MKLWLTLCFTKPVMKRASWTALIVGTILILINHGNPICFHRIQCFYPDEHGGWDQNP